ncbi:unnamed protein product, partial [Meganyctiphanes norvegica]
SDGSPIKPNNKDTSKSDASRGVLQSSTNNTSQVHSSNGKQQQSSTTSDVPGDCYLKHIHEQLDKVVVAHDNSGDLKVTPEEDEAAVPRVWVSKWVDYSDKYGLGYQLSDDSIGVLFNDFTKMMLMPDGINIHYIERSGEEHQHILKDCPNNLSKKVTLLRYFRNYMNEHLLKAAASTMVPRENGFTFQTPSLRTYFRTRSAIILHLTDGTFQVNFFEDHSKVIVCPHKGSVTFIDNKRDVHSYWIKELQKGCRTDLANRLRYAKNMIQKLIMSKVVQANAAENKNNSKPKPAQPTMEIEAQI